MEGLRLFFESQPLDILRGADSLPENLPSITGCRDLLVSGNTPSDEIDSMQLKQLYLFAIGMGISLGDADESITKDFDEMESQQHFEGKLGFSYEMNEDLDLDEDIDGMNFEQLRKFCFSKGLTLPASTSVFEYRRTAHYLQENSEGPIDFHRMGEFMNSAIDVSIIAQNISKLTEDLRKQAPVDCSADEIIKESQEILKGIDKTLTMAIRLRQQFQTEAPKLAAARFQRRYITYRRAAASFHPDFLIFPREEEEDVAQSNEQTGPIDGVTEEEEESNNTM